MDRTTVDPLFRFDRSRSSRLTKSEFRSTLLSSRHSYRHSYGMLMVLIVANGTDAFLTSPPLPPPLRSLYISSTRYHPRRLFRSSHHQTTPNQQYDDDDDRGGSDGRFGRLNFSYKRVRSSPPLDLQTMTPDAAAESIERLLRDRERTTEQAYIGSLDAWMVASNKAKQKAYVGADESENASANRDRIMKYGRRMENVLTLMEDTCEGGTTIDAYATVIHLYVGGKESYAALRVLARMECRRSLLRTTTTEGKDTSSLLDDQKLRLIQYNRVLQGLGSTLPSEPSHREAAVGLLIAMCGQDEFNHSSAGLVEPFTPTDLVPDAKSFASVVVPMLQLEEEEGENWRVMELIERAKDLGRLSGFLSKKIDRAIVGNRDEGRFDGIRQQLDL